MRDVFASSVIALQECEDLFFLTGDLGYMALEPVREAFGSRFINAGVAEQNMIGVAAGLAREGLRVIVYSIAPFCYARPFEQIRNDLCMSKLPVCLVGNGGGYAYGHMGPTHHALEDCAAMAALGVRVVVPAFDDDIPAILEEITAPTYLRLGYDERPADTTPPPYDQWRLLLPGSAGAFAALGPISGLAWKALIDLPEVSRPALWAVSEPSSGIIPIEFLSRANRNNLYVAEEHVAAGGLGMQIAFAMQRVGYVPDRFVHRHALGYPSGRFGSQAFHRTECGLHEEGLLNMLIDN